MAALTDRQIGQLMIDHVGRDLGIVQPEATILQHGTQRLFRSTGGSLTAEEVDNQQRRPCPKCGNDMLLHYGIDEPDCWHCVFVKCQHKANVLDTETEEQLG